VSVEEVPRGATHNVDKRQIVSSHEPLVGGDFRAHLLQEGDRVLHEILKLRIVLKACQPDLEDLTQYCRIVLSHLSTHLGGKKRVLRNEINALAARHRLKSVLHLDATLRNELTAGSLQDG